MKYMEHLLDLPLRDVLGLLQDRIVGGSKYFGVPALKCPLDFWVYQELLFAIRPDVILEVGNRFGGSTLAFAHLCDLLGHGRVIGLDLSHADVSVEVKQHGRITLIEGDACANADKVFRMIGEHETVFVIEDSSHTFENTLNVLTTFSPLVKPGGYFVVEDGICHHGLSIGPFPGPYEAIETFVKNRDDFIVDRTRESYLITWNPKGYLKRVR